MVVACRLRWDPGREDITALTSSPGLHAGRVPYPSRCACRAIRLCVHTGQGSRRAICDVADRRQVRVSNSYPRVVDASGTEGRKDGAAEETGGLNKSLSP